MKIKEKVLKESFEWMFQHTYRDSKNLKESVNMPSTTSYEVSESIKKAIDLTLVEVGKVIDNELRKIGEIYGNCELTEAMNLFSARMNQLKKELGI